MASQAELQASSTDLNMYSKQLMFSIVTAPQFMTSDNW